MKRKTIIILSILALILALVVYSLLLLFRMYRWAEIWLAGMLSCILTIVCFWLIFKLLNHLTRRFGKSKELFRNHCPVCGTAYSGKLESCPNCGNPSQ